MSSRDVMYKRTTCLFVDENVRQALGLSINRISIISGLLDYSYYEHPVLVNTGAVIVRVQSVGVTGSLFLYFQTIHIYSFFYCGFFGNAT